MDYEVKLEMFEGPLDLLLHLIHKNEVDIFDIPIATITDQYLEHIDIMKALNINIAGDFLLMASTLTHLKSKMLLPERESENDEEVMEEITRPLLEYMRFKEAAHTLSDREILERDVFSRKTPADLKKQIHADEPQLDVNLFQLMDAFKRVIDQQVPGSKLDVQIEKWSVQDKIEELIARLKEKGPLFFYDVFKKDRRISEFVVSFLALLELAHMGLIKIFQPTPDSDIQLIPSFNKTEETNGNDSGKSH